MCFSSVLQAAKFEHSESNEVQRDTEESNLIPFSDVSASNRLAMFTF